MGASGHPNVVPWDLIFFLLESGTVDTGWELCYLVEMYTPLNKLLETLQYKIGMNEQKCLALLCTHKITLFKESSFVCCKDSETFLLIHTTLIL